MSSSNDTVFIYVLQRISDKAYLYIGSAKNPERRFQEHKRSNPYPVIQDAFAKENIRFLIITQTDESHRIDAERKFWCQFKRAGHPIVNIDPSFVAWEYGNRLSEEHKQKISKALKGKPKDPAVVRKVAEAKKGSHHSAETRHKMSVAHKGRIVGEETRRKLAELSKGRRHTEDARLKIKEAWKHRPPVKDETRRKLSEAGKGRTSPNKGKHPSEETRRKMSESHKARLRSK